MTRSVEAHAARILSSLYAVETALLIVLAGAYKSTAYDSTLLSTKAGAALILGAVGLIASGHVLARQIVASGSARGKALGPWRDHQPAVGTCRLPAAGGCRASSGDEHPGRNRRRLRGGATRLA